jgi:hypothetical protein
LPHKSKASLTNKGKERNAHQGRRSLAKRGRGGGGGCCTERRREARYRGVATCGAVGMRCKEGRCRTGKSRPCLRGIICPPGPGHRGRKESHFVPRVHTLRSVAAETCPCHAIVLFMDLFAKKKVLFMDRIDKPSHTCILFLLPFPTLFPILVYLALWKRRRTKAVRLGHQTTGKKLTGGRRPFPALPFYSHFTATPPPPTPSQHFSPSFYGTCFSPSAVDSSRASRPPSFNSLMAFTCSSRISKSLPQASQTKRSHK